jgi:hypothetical protein
VPAKPGPTTTGVPAGTQLKVHTGDLVVSTPGAVIDGVDVRGQVRVMADNVTIKNSIVRGRAYSSVTHLVSVSAKGFRMVDSEVFADVPSPYVMGVVGSHFTLERVDIHTVIDQVTVIGDDVTITGSWLHGNLYYAQDPNHGGKESHDDNVQVQIGKNLTMTNNVLEGSRSGALMITQGRGKVSDVTFSKNWIDGGSCSVNISEYKSGPLAGLKFTDNVFGTNTRHAYCGIIKPVTTTIAQSGNTFTDGHTFAVKRG